MNTTLKVLSLAFVLTLASCGSKKASQLESIGSDALSSNTEMGYCKQDLIDDYNQLAQYCKTTDTNNEVSITSCMNKYDEMTTKYKDLKCLAQDQATSHNKVITTDSLDEIRGIYTPENVLASTDNKPCGIFVVNDLHKISVNCVDNSSKTQMDNCIKAVDSNVKKYPELYCQGETQDGKRTFTNAELVDILKQLKELRELM